MARAWRLAELVQPEAASGPRWNAATEWPSYSSAIRARGHSLRGHARAAILSLATAAALVLGVCIGIFWPAREGAARLSTEEFITGPHEMVTTRLSDGTIVRLAPESRLSVTSLGATREVWLDGHAFFAVARDAGRRFVVRTRAGDAVVLGTRFDVQVEDSGMQVFVVEGRVAHQAAGQEVQVRAMEISRARAGHAPAVQPIADAAPLLNWLGGFLVFQATPLREVARELERRFAVTVRVADAKLEERTVTAWFTDEDLEQVVLIVCRAAGVRCLIRDTTVSIEP
jgi:transmembrane sensor